MFEFDQDKVSIILNRIAEIPVDDWSKVKQDDPNYKTMYNTVFKNIEIVLITGSGSMSPIIKINGITISGNKVCSISRQIVDYHKAIEDKKNKEEEQKNFEEIFEKFK